MAYADTEDASVLLPSRAIPAARGLQRDRAEPPAFVWQRGIEATTNCSPVACGAARQGRGGPTPLPL